MGFKDWFFGGYAPATPSVSPWQTPSDVTAITIHELWGDAAPEVITRDIAMRVPGVKRAHNVHCGLVAGIPFRQQDNGVVDDPQPEWLYRTDSQISPYLRMFGVTSDLFHNGWALLGAELGDDDFPRDAIHVPHGLWKVDPYTGVITIDDRIPAKYRQLPIAIPLGSNGVLTDGIDTLRAARQLEFAHMDRIENPIAQTELHINDDTVMTPAQQKRLAENYNAGRKAKGGATSVTPSNVDVKTHGQIATDLFESGRNAIRLDIANHTGVPASIIEGSKNGSSGEINYSNESSARNELYDFGTSLFVNAIEARLSMDDVCPPGKSIRGDLTHLMSVPTPNQNPASED